jgi:excisionase family DNA binding protein
VEEETYTTGQAARILKVTDRGVRKMIGRGELEASTDERGRHQIPQRALHAMLEERRASGAEEITGEEASRSSEEAWELRERVEGLQRELGRLEGRLELTERTESTMREERERLEQLLEERAERRRLQEQLDTERSKGFWQRLFGG